MKIFLYVILMTSCFFASYKGGMSINQNKTLLEAQAEMDKVLAIKAISRINALQEIKANINEKNKLICTLKNEVHRLAADWQYCKSDATCIKEWQGGLYDKLDDIIEEFEHEVCEPSTDESKHKLI